MNQYLVILIIIIIILSLIYLLYRNQQYNKLLESFQSYSGGFTQGSLSTFYQPTVDRDMYETNNNSYNTQTLPTHQSTLNWNGIWEYNDPTIVDYKSNKNIWAQFIQNNDLLIMAFTNSKFTKSDTIKYTIKNAYELKLEPNQGELLENGTFTAFVEYVSETSFIVTIKRTSGIGTSLPGYLNLYIYDLSDPTISYQYPIPASSTTPQTYALPPTSTTSPVILQKDTLCYQGSFIGIGQLNFDKSAFILKKVICNNYPEASLNLTPQQLSGVISKNSSNNRIVTLYSNGGSTIILNWKKDFIYNNLTSNNTFINGLMYNINNTPIISEDDKYIMRDQFPCPEGKSKCFVPKTNGTIIGYQRDIVPLKEYTDTVNNSCCNDSNTYNYNSTTKEHNINCSFSQNPMLVTGITTEIPKCTPISLVSDYMNFMPLQGLVNMSNSTLYICDYLSRFSSAKCNACVIAYQDNLGNVLTLNYQFFGITPNESNLTLQLDKFNTFLNNPTSKITYIKDSRNNLKLGDLSNPNIGNSANIFGNCLQNKQSTDYSSIQDTITSCKTTTKDKAKNFIFEQQNDLFPLIWQINGNNNPNLLNSCGVYINSFPDYPISQKYIEYERGKIFVTPNKGGLNQQLIFDNVNIVKDYTTEKPYFIMTTNIKTLNNLYLLPSVDQGFSNNSHTVRLANKPNEAGNWLIFGFNITSISQVEDKFTTFST